MNGAKVVGIVMSSSLFAFNCLSAWSADQAKIIKISAKRFEFIPNQITLKKGTPVVFQITTQDRSHGFVIDGLNLRTDVEPGKVAELRVDPQKAGQYDFYCDVFCGSGHDGMTGKITVTD